MIQRLLALLDRLMMGPGARPRPEIAAAATIRSKRLDRRPVDLRDLWDSPVGACRIDLDGRITSIAGGALREVGTTPEDWIGTTVQDPWRSEGWVPASQGRPALLAQLDPVGKGRQHVILYCPEHSGDGTITGVLAWWLVLPPGQFVRTDIPEGPHG